ncbi:hypothetical protein IGI04_007356, partial [Brassica rapa subsp. trilocularis]
MDKVGARLIYPALGQAVKPYACSLVAYMGAPNSRNNDQDFIRKADIDALIKMFKDNGNIYGYSYGASMIARTVGDLDCITRTDTTPTSDHGGERSEPETTQESSGASGTHDQDVEAKPPSDAEGLERIRPFMDKVGARLIYPALGQAVKPYACQAGEGGTREPGDSKALVTYTAQPSLQNNRENEYLRRSDLDSLIKMLKENGNTLGTL